jgi:hypothetical protein
MILGGEIGSERLVGGSERVGMDGWGGGEEKSGRKANGDNRQPNADWALGGRWREELLW